jgi:hypothetical protein
MADNVLQTIQKLLQDVIAPDIRETKVRVDEMQKQIDVRLAAIEKQVEIRVGGIEQRMVYLEKSLLSAFAESQARIEITGSKAVIDRRERVAVLESKHA